MTYIDEKGKRHTKTPRCSETNTEAARSMPRRYAQCANRTADPSGLCWRHRVRKDRVRKEEADA